MFVVEAHRKNHGFVTKTDLKKFYVVFCVVLAYIFSLITYVIFNKFIDIYHEWFNYNFSEYTARSFG